MSIIVQKYGGTSVGSIEKILAVANNIIDSLQGGVKLVVIVSAMSGQTDKLFAMAHEITKTTRGKEIDGLVATGEQITVSLLTLALQSSGINAVGFCGWQIPIVTTDDFTYARIKKISSDKILNELATNQVVVVAGFQGVTENGHITTFGRGGSDTSAVAIAVALNAQECQIFTDVNGVYNADPNKVTTAKRIDKLNGDIMLEAASLGAKVLHVRSCELAYRYKLNIRVLSTFAPQDQGSLVVNSGELENYPIISMSQEDEQTLFRLNLSEDKKIQQNQLIADLYNICCMDMLHITPDNISFGVAFVYVDEITKFLITNNIKYSLINNLSKLSLIGSGFRSNSTLNKNIWQALDGIELFAISHNELSFSMLIHNLDVIKVRNKLSHLL